MDSITFVTSPADVSVRENEWTQLFTSTKSSSSNPFCAPKVWFPWLEAHPDYTPILCEGRSETGELIAGIGLYQNGQSVFAVGDQHLDYQEILAHHLDDAVQLISEIVNHCAERGLTLTFAKVAENSLLFEALHHSEIEAIANIRGRYWSHCPTTSFAKTDTADFVAALPKKRKKNFKAAASRIRKALPDFEVEHLSKSEITRAVIHDIAMVHQENQHRKSGASVFLEPGFPNFLQLQAENGSDLVLTLLREESNGELIAFNLGFFDGKTYFYYIPSYQGQFAHLSPGSWLLVETLRHHFEQTEGDTFSFDMLSGAEAYKAGWETDRYNIQRIQVIPKKITNIPRLAAFSAIYGLKAWKNRVKKIA